MIPPPNNLPAPTTSFIGRETDVTAVVTRLSQPDVRLLTLTGPGGSGKTRLSLQVAAKLVEHYADGVFFVSLAPISNPDLVGSTMVQTLGLQVSGNTPPLDVLKGYLRNKCLLLVLDNFEQLLAAAPLLIELLAAAPGVKMLVTSRTVLRVSGEQEYLVPPLPLPDLTHPPALAQLARNDAVRLFAERAAASKRDFVLTEENTPVVAEICIRLDGLPLAIELAAARIGLFSPHTLLARLAHPLHLLTWGLRDLPARQQTLRNTLDWSYHLLNSTEQTIFRRLAVFVGGWTLEAAEAIGALANDPSASSGQVVDVLNGVQALVDHNLVSEVDVNGEPRCTMLETIRQYALERLAESGEEETIQQQHARFFLALAEEDEQLMDRTEQPQWLRRLGMEYNNLRAALDWSMEYNHEIGIRLAGALCRFWENRVHIWEGRKWLTKALAMNLETGMERWRAKALHAASVLAVRQADLSIAMSLGEKSVELWRTVGDTRWLAHVLQRTGNIGQEYGSTQRARTLLKESITLYRQIGDTHGLSRALFIYGNLLLSEQKYDDAQVILEESLSLGQKEGNIQAIACATYDLGDIPMIRGAYPTAQRLYEQGLKRAREFELSNAIDIALYRLGILADRQGHYDQARAYYGEALEMTRKRGHEIRIAWLLIGLGWVAFHQHHQHEAHAHFTESLALFQKRDYRSGIVASLLGLTCVAQTQEHLEQADQLVSVLEEWLPEIAHDPQGQGQLFPSQDEYNRLVATARSALGEEAFAVAIARGRTLTLEQAVAYALQQLPTEHADRNPEAGSNPLQEP